MASYPTVDLALADLRDPELFARVATVVLSEELPGIVPTGRSGDLGRDAYVREAVVGEETIAIQFSLESDWQGKVRRELERHERDPTLPPQLLFVTNREPTEAKVRDLRSFAQERYGVTLTIRGREWLAAQLERWQLRDVAERLLGVRPDRPRRVVPAARYRERLAAHTAGFGAELVGAQDSIAEIADALRASRVVLVTGEGGVGKTRLALTAAGEEASVVASGQSFDDATALELLSRPPGPVVIDDAHRADALHAVRVVLDDPRFADVRLLVTVRTGTERAVTDAAGVSPGEAATVRLGRLPRAAIDRLVAAPPHPVSVHALRLRIVRLAEGRPLAAHLACEAAHRGDLRTAAGELDVWTGYLERLLDVRWPSFYGDVLAVCAAIGGIDPTADGDLAALRAALPGRADDELLAALDSLADHGALFELGGRLAVKPDRLAAFVVWNRLLAPAPRRHLTWQRATDGLPSPRRHRLLPVLVEAVAMGDGTGGELILTQLRQSQWPPPEGDTAPGTRCCSTPRMSLTAFRVASARCSTCS